MSNQIDTINRVRGLADSPAIHRRIQEVLGRRAPMFVSSVVQLVQQSPSLQKCEPGSILGAAMTATTLELSIHPSLGHAYVVPYGSKAQFQIGYKGFIQLAQRSGQFAALNDFIVPAGCLRKWNPITGELDADMDAETEGEPDGYGFYFRLTNGFEKTVYWSREKVIKHAERFSHAYKKGRQDSPWFTDFDSMALKTVTKYALGKYAPLSIDMQRAASSDQAVIDIETGREEYPDNEPEKLERPKPPQPPERQEREVMEEPDAIPEDQSAPTAEDEAAEKDFYGEEEK